VGCEVNGLSVIVPSRKDENLRLCLAAVRKHEPDLRIIVVDDGLQTWEWAKYMPLDRRQGVKPFVFSRAINQGIAAAGQGDVVILNDDALLESPGGFKALQRAAAENPGYGLVSATTDVAGNTQQFRQKADGVRVCSRTPGNSFATVAFVCVLIPRRTINAVGLLDTRFGGMTPAGKRIYGYEDNDYCRRVSDAGLQIAIHDGCYVEHSAMPSTFRSEPYDMEAARQIYIEKWGKM
jgi:GT2 family glycosyltransferase